MPRDTSIPGDGSDEFGAKYCRVIYHSPTIAEEWHLTVQKPSWRIYNFIESEFISARRASAARTVFQ